MTGLRGDLIMTWALMRRGVNELLRVPAAGIPGILAPTIFMVGLTAVFGSLTLLPGFTTDDYITFILPVGFLQGAGFTGAATGVNLARDIELGWFDRLLASPAPRGVLLAGTVLSASLRTVLPFTLLMIVGLSLGAQFPGVDGLLLALAIAAVFAAVAASYAVTLALKFRTQAAAPLMQAGVFMAVLFTSSYAPEPLLTGWLKDVAAVNPVTLILDAVRQGFVGGVSWSDTWPGLLALAGLGMLVVALAMRGLRRTSA
jgi:ABC-type multidrug transport system permease subunit